MKYFKNNYDIDSPEQNLMTINDEKKTNLKIYLKKMIIIIKKMKRIKNMMMNL